MNIEDAVKEFKRHYVFGRCCGPDCDIKRNHHICNSATKISQQCPLNKDEFCEVLLAICKMERA